MNIGSLYKVKKYFWLLFPTKETAADNARLLRTLDALARREGLLAAAVAAADSAAGADYWSRVYNCEVTSPESFIVFLEEDKKFKQVLTVDGRIGWISFNKDYISCFEEVSNE